MKLTGGEIVARALADEGIRYAFGIPGTHNIELYDALARSPVRPVLVTDEQSAPFMADAVWRASGRLACVNVVPGAGLTHALSGIAEAFMDTIPLVVLGCGIRRDTGKAYQLHDVDQRAIAQPITKATFLVERGEDLYATIRRACAAARAGAPGPVMVEVPVNLYWFRHEVTSWEAPPAPTPIWSGSPRRLGRRWRRPFRGRACDPLPRFGSPLPPRTPRLVFPRVRQPWGSPTHHAPHPTFLEK